MTPHSHSNQSPGLTFSTELFPVDLFPSTLELTHMLLQLFSLSRRKRGSSDSDLSPRAGGGTLSVVVPSGTLRFTSAVGTMAELNYKNWFVSLPFSLCPPSWTACVTQSVLKGV